MSSTNAEALSASTSTFLTSLSVNGAIAGGEFVAWLIVRRVIKAVYEPRTYIPPTKDQAGVLGDNIFGALWRIVNSDSEEVLAKNGVDPYVFLRFLRMMAKAMIPIWFISWAVLLPVDAANSSVDGKTGLDRFTFGNVAKDKQHRYWAHLLLTIGFNAWILYLVWHEMKAWLSIRQRHLVSPEHSRLAQASTVLITGIPLRYMDEERLAQLFAHLPGGVKRIWLNRDLKEMPDLYNRRMKACAKLESAQTNLAKLARQRKIDVAKKIEQLERKGKPVPDDLRGVANPDLLKTDEPVEAAPRTGAEPTQLSLADQLVPRKKRPTTRLKPNWAPFGLGFLGIGEKVDTIDWAQKEIAYCNRQLEEKRGLLEQDINHPGIGEENFPPLSSAFIHFNQQIAAHMAQQCLAHNQPYKMSGRFIEQSPANVLWRNMALNSYEQNIRQAISYAITGGLIIAWSFPVAFLGAMSSVTTLVAEWSWLEWIEGDSFGKELLQGAITGILPPVLLALLMQLLPAVLRQLAAFEGKPSKTEVELDLMTRYFVFLVVHTFLIVTLSSGLVAAVQDIADNPSSVATILASQLPTASTFFITLVLTQFTGTAGTLLQYMTLLLYYVRVILGGGTPRNFYKSRYRMPTNNWGTTFPGVTVYAVIMISYMVISPIINGFGACFFMLCYVVYKYLYIWVVNQPAQTDTGGLFFPKAVSHIFVGMYIQEICICALFFLARDDNDDVSALPEAIIMIIVIVLTAAYHYILNQSYGPLVHNLPLSLAHMTYGMPKEEGHEGSVIGEDSPEASATASKPQQADGNDDAPLLPTVRPSLILPSGDDGAAEELPKRPSFQSHRSSHTSFTSFTRRKQQEGVEPHDFARDPSALANTLGVPGGEGHDEKRAHDTLQPGDGLVAHAPGEPNPESPTRAIPTVPGPPIVNTAATAALVSVDADIEMSPLSVQAPSVQSERTGQTSGTAHTAATADTGGTADNAGTDKEEVYFAVPGGPGLVRGLQDDANDPMAFFHPATKEPQRIVWLPRDELGLIEAEIEENVARGVESTDRNAFLDRKGRVTIRGPPPDLL
ncbi:phosphate metabolism protein 7 [Cryptotrichosporon argae]